MKRIKRCVIVGGADIYNCGFIRDTLCADDYVDLCDSGLKYLQRYFVIRNVKAYSQKTKVSNLKGLNEMANYLKVNEIYTIEDLESRVSDLKNSVDELRKLLWIRKPPTMDVSNSKKLTPLEKRCQFVT